MTCSQRDGRHRCYHRVLFFVLLATILAISSAKKLQGIAQGGAKSINFNRAFVRGGASYYESNPNYHGTPPSSSYTLGDLDEQGAYYRTSTLNHSPKPLITNYFASLRQFSPTLFYGTTSSLFFFLLWQFQSSSHLISKILRNHFVCSHYNVMKKKRFHAAFLSAFSHASLHHLVVNLYAFSMFGRSVKQTLANQGVDLWPFVFAAAIFSSLTFLVLDRGDGSCIGLSGVTLALLAFDSLIYPSKELRMVISFIPIQLPAYYLFLGLVFISCAGIMGLIGGNVAHSTHLGGLIFGKLFFEAFKRGWVRNKWNYNRKLYF
ncbi:hypothetical protein ACHAWC_002235 [Mediolabrus comicus]